jgi:hypothetical protein
MGQEQAMRCLFIILVLTGCTTQQQKRCASEQRVSQFMKVLHKAEADEKEYERTHPEADAMSDRVVEMRKEMRNESPHTFIP